MLAKLPESPSRVFRYVPLARPREIKLADTRVQCTGADKARVEAASGGIDPLFSSLSTGGRSHA